MRILRTAALGIGLGCSASAPETLPPAQPLPGDDPVAAIPFADAMELRAAEPAGSPPRLEAGDMVEVTVYGHPDLTARARIPPDGKVTLAFVGEVTLRGRTVGDVQDELRKAYESRYLVSAPVSILVTDPVRREAFVVGQVKRPGAYPFPTAGGLTFLQALSHAGGFETDADREGVLLIRAGADGRRSLYRLSYTALEREGRVEADVPLRTGDVLLVPGRGSITVLGSVTEAGVFPITAEGMRASQAIARARGLTRFAAPNRAVVTRRLAGGESVAVPIALGEILRGERPDPLLKAGDVLYVPESLF